MFWVIYLPKFLANPDIKSKDATDGIWSEQLYISQLVIDGV